MNNILSHIMHRKREYTLLPLFNYMRDDSIIPEQRLAFYPCMAHFIMSFSDLNKYMLRDELSSEPYQELVNSHTYEDDYHWVWYLEDYAKLGFNRPLQPTEQLKFMFGEQTKCNRILSYHLAKLILPANSKERLVIIEAIEETGNVLFDLTAKLAEQIYQRSGIRLRYCGHFHFNKESGHAIGADESLLAKMEFDEVATTRALQLVDEVFYWFGEWTNELLSYAKSHPAPGLLENRDRLVAAIADLN